MKNKGFSSIKLFLGVIAGNYDLPATTDEREKAGHRCTLYMRCVSYLATIVSGAVYAGLVNSTASYRDEVVANVVFCPSV